ncbi:TPA: hypothetical protein EYP45_00430, partial [Candidatus Peregrinibacteria bacterium]|nr:hypothetical protein [Candidatus Peregrinibacteria bacterium]
KIPVSDTQAYQQFGNSVPVKVIEAIAKEMLPHLYEYIRCIFQQCDLMKTRAVKLSLFLNLI